MSLGIDLPQEKTQLLPGSNFKGLRKIGADTTTIQDMHGLLPAHGFPQLIHELLLNAVDRPIPQRRHVGVYGNDWFADIGGQDGASHRCQCGVHQARVKRARRR